MSLACARRTRPASVGTAAPSEKTLYYAESADGVGYLAEAVEKKSIGFMGEERVTLAAPDEAKVFDAMGPEDCDVQFIVNTLYVKTRVDRTQTMTVDGRDIEFTKEYTRGQIGSWDGVTLAPGYVFVDGFSPNQQWAWSPYYGSGWSARTGRDPQRLPVCGRSVWQLCGALCAGFLRSGCGWSRRGRTYALTDEA